MSIRNERVVYRERDIERDRDSDRATQYEAPRRTYTTVKRYQVPEASRSLFNGEDRVEEDKQIVIRRERREPSPPREEVKYRVKERVIEHEQPREEVDYRFTERIRERDREPLSPQRRDIAYRVIERDSDHDRHSTARSEFRVVEREREIVRAPSPPPLEQERVREYRFERERDFSPPRRREVREQPYDVEKYSKSTEYYSQPQPQPQPIIIREAAPQPIIIREERREPIIIREERREPQYEFIEREEVRDETRSLVRREEPPAPSIHAPSVHAPSVHPSIHRTASSHTEKPEEENYFYERRVIERAPRRRDDSYDDRRSEVRPRDSASQYSSDDSYEYIRKERVREDSRSRSGSPHHRRHLAEGAIAGIGAAELFRHHKKSQGEDVGGRAKSAVAGAAVGAIGAEAVSRVRAYSRRRKSRSRSRSSSYDDRRDRRDRRKKRSRSRSKSRSKSLSRTQQLGALAAVTAVGALAGYALKNKGKNKETIIVKDEAPRRSRSRRRRASVDSYGTENTMLSDGGGRALDPEHRNRRMAQAGLASAAAAGIWDRVRSKSRGGRSQSRVKQAVPIVASGLGGAALAGLYEKNKASKEAKKAAIIEDEIGRGRRPASRRRSRSRSRSVPAPYPADDRYVDDRGLIAYGHEPIYPEEQRRGYYSDEEPGNYRRRHHGGSSSGSSPDTRRRRSQSRSRSRGPGIAGVGAAAGAAAVAAHEIGRRRERSRQREEVHHKRRDSDPYQYGHDQYPLDSPTPQGGGYLPPHQQGAYGNNPADTYFPPPPTGDYARGEPAHADAPYPQYNPADYAQAPQQPYHQSYGAYGDSEVNLGAPNENYNGDPRYAAATPDATPHEERNRGRNPENVSAPNQDEQENADGVSTPRRERSQSRVRFNLDANETKTFSTEAPQRDNDEWHTDSESRTDRKHRRHRRSEDDRERGSGGHRGSHDNEHDSDSDGTVELPQRFDEHGNPKPDTDPVTESLTQLLGGAGLAGLLGHLGGGANESNDNNDTGRSRRRRRHRH
ncbi:hypothetical protein LTR10_007231 [Elasticomyces elasticus]|nr:hypothetical protein LTR10_007231 [Elasticomyces elasticus]KAK4979048.1 hypothetical protein LTR42_001548 [Elasticomyces elasticus]